MHIQLIQYGLAAWQSSVRPSASESPIWQGEGYPSPDEALRDAKAILEYLEETSEAT